ncbi:MAG: rRNA maturation RNase YbeY [Lachnospiraceae bacterium]|nr:rRNA maturation RNase YbeY [Lachnospiraceae bacterium]
MVLYSECEEDFLPDYEKTAKEVIEKAVEKHGGLKDYSVNLYIVDDETIRETNRDTRGIDSVTDVLSFPNLELYEGDLSPIDDMDRSDISDPETGEILLGEIMICKNRVFEQAEEYGHSPLREYAFLVTHSILHLLGYDHMEDEERERMEKKQKEILEELGITRERS